MISIGTKIDVLADEQPRHLYINGVDIAEIVSDVTFFDPISKKMSYKARLRYPGGELAEFGYSR